MSNANDATVSLKVMINKQKTEVLFAEAGSDFTDILLSFLTLPLGKIAKLLDDRCGDEAPAVGSLSNLYRSVANLDGIHFVNEAAKLMLLNPRSAFEDICPNLKLDVSDTQPTQYFTCNGPDCSSKIVAKNICVYYGSGSCHYCGRSLVTQMSVMDTKGGDRGGFTINTASFVISDDLRVMPNNTGFLQTLRNFGIGDTNIGAELREVTFGIDKIIGLLRRCLLSETPLTDLILNKTQEPSSAAKQSHPKISLKTDKMEDVKSKNIILKITVQKSSNKLLFAQGEADFAELLFSFLTIPLGGVESLLDNNTCLKNLYKSLSDSIEDRYFTTPSTKNRLMNPKLPPGYSCRKQFLPLSEESFPTFYIYNRELYYNSSHANAVLVPFFKSPKGPDSYVKEPTTYLVTDDLTVTPFGMTMGLSILDRFNIPLSDVHELEVHIGLEQALGILRASLTSTSALSTALINHMPKKRPKLEPQLVGKVV